MKELYDFTTGSVSKKMITFAAPLFLSNMLQAVYNLVDMIIVGHFVGKTGLSAVSIGGDLLTLLTFLSIGFSGAGQVIIAQNRKSVLLFVYCSPMSKYFQSSDPFPDAWLDEHTERSLGLCIRLYGRMQFRLDLHIRI